MEFRILGPFEASVDAVPLALPRGKQKALLALLLLHADRVVAVDRIVDELWGEAVPETAPKMVQIYVSQLRKLLPRDCCARARPAIVARPRRPQLDLRAVRALSSRTGARRARRRAAPRRHGIFAGRARVLARAGARPSSSEPFAQLEAARLEEVRLAASRSGSTPISRSAAHGDLVGELDALVARHPLREGLRRQQMLALYRSGRQAEALAAYQGLPARARRRARHRAVARAERARAADPPAGPRARLPLAPLRRRHSPAASPSHLRPREPRACPSCGHHSRPSPGSARPAARRPAAPPAEEMLKLVTVLFADVVGSTALGGGSSTRRTSAALMTDYFAAMAAEIEAEGGTVEKFVGDAIMAVFGVPTAHEDDAVRAVRAARRMLERLRSWNEERDPTRTARDPHRREHGRRARLRCARAATCSSPATRSTSPRGSSRPPSRGRSSSPSARRVPSRSHFELRALDEPLALKGRPSAVAAWLVEADREAVEPRGVPGVAAPLVGRDHELAFLRTAFERVCRERPARARHARRRRRRRQEPARARVPLAGSTASAKVLDRALPPVRAGRDALAARRDAQGGGGRARHGHAPTRRSAKIARLVEATHRRRSSPPSRRAPRRRSPRRSACGCPATRSARSIRASSTASWSPRGARCSPRWRAAQPGRRRRRGPPLGRPDDARRARRARRAPRRADPLRLHGAARPAPLASRLGRRAAELQLAAARPAERRGERAPRLAPARRRRAARTALRRLILERSEGNPFFLEEIVRHLIDDGLLVATDGRWRARAGIERVEIPDNVQAVILARLDLLCARREARRAARGGRRARLLGRRRRERSRRSTISTPSLQTLRRREFVLERLVVVDRRPARVRLQARPDPRRRLREPAAAGARPRARGRRGVDRADERRADRRAGGAARAPLRRGVLVPPRRRPAAEGARPPAGRRGERAPPLRDPAGRAPARSARSSSPQAGAERAEALEALGDLHYLAFHGDAAWRTYCEALAELPEGDPAFARLAGKAEPVRRALGRDDARASARSTRSAR